MNNYFNLERLSAKFVKNYNINKENYQNLNNKLYCKKNKTNIDINDKF